MKICGLNKTTLLDYPGHVAATLFLGGCNYRCPFCQNGGLVLHPEKESGIPTEEILAFLKKRRGILEGVCISGGEPTLSAGLFDLAQAIKELGFPIKLDTNGSRPDVVKKLRAQGLIDMAAMDVKTCPEQYPRLTGISAPDVEAVKETAAFLLEGDMPYEFRTTVVDELHSAGDFAAIGRWLSGAKAYFLQEYRDSEQVIAPGFHSANREKMEEYLGILKKTIPAAKIRGME